MAVRLMTTVRALKEKRNQNQHHQQTAEEDGGLEISDGPLDESGLAEQSRCSLIPGGSVACSSSSALQVRCNGERIGIRLPVDDEQNAGLAVDDALPSYWQAEPDIGDVTERERHTVAKRDGSCGQVGRRSEIGSLADR